MVRKVRKIISKILSISIYKIGKVGYDSLIILPLKKSKKNNVIIGNHNYIGKKCHFGADVVIKNYVMIADSVSFVGGDHEFSLLGEFMCNSGRGSSSVIVVESDTWIGHGAIVLDGITVGRGSIIGAGSVVTKDVHPYTVVAGNPAKVIKKRFDEDLLNIHEEKLNIKDSNWKS